MIQKLKNILFRMLCRLTAYRCRCKGVAMGTGCTIDGMPELQVCKGSQITLGDGVTLLSNHRHNPLISQRVSIITSSPNASIDIGFRAGISGCFLLCDSRISIGRYTIIGPDTRIIDSGWHGYDKEIGWAGTRGRSAHPICIGEKCFIGTQCLILAGVTIGDRCVISAGSVVSSDVPDGHLAYGNPIQIKPLPPALGGPAKSKKAKNNPA